MESSIKVVLVGHDLHSKCEIGNIIRGSNEFKPLQCRKVVVKSLRSSTVQGHNLHICVTPNLLTPLWCDVRHKYQNDKNSVFLYVHDYSGAALDDSVKEVKSYFGEKSRICRVILCSFDEYEKARDDIKPGLYTVIISRGPKWKDRERKKILSALSDFLSAEEKILTKIPKTKGDEVDASRGEVETDSASKGPSDLEDEDRMIIESVAVDSNRPSTPSLNCRDLRSKDWELYSQTLREGSAPSSHLRVNIVGHQCVGKTTLLHRLQGNTTPVPLESISCTKGLDIQRITSKYIERDDKKIWECQIKGYEKELNIQRMASAMRRCKENEDESVGYDTEPNSQIAASTMNTKAKDGEAEEGGYGAGLNGKRVASAMITKATDKEPEEGEFKSYPREINPEANAEKAISVDQAIAKDKQPGEMLDADLLFSSDTIEDDMNQSFTSQCDTNNSSKSVITAEKENYLSQIVRCVEHSRGERLYVSFWDFAGQSGYYSTHQAFLSPSSVYVLVVSLEKDIDEDIEDNIEFNFDVSKRTKMTVYDTMKFWIDSIRTYTADSNGAHAPVILVGTHKDKVSEEKANETLRLICERLHIPVFISIDNTLDIEKDPYLNELKSLIVERGLGVAEPDIPAKWINLERVILTEQEKGTAVLSFNDLKELDKQTDMPLNDANNLREFLNHEHLHGWILYFESEDLENIIILDPMILVHFLNLLLEKRDDDKAALYVRVAASGFCRDGIFDEKYIQDLAQKFDQHHAIVKHMNVLLKIVVHLRIAFPLNIPETVNKQYFMPSLLNERVQKEKEDIPSLPTIVIDFGDACAPPAIFHRLIASCLWNNLQPYKAKDGSIQISNGHARFILTQDRCKLLQLEWKKCQIHILAFEYGKPTDELAFNTALKKVVNVLEEIIDLYRHQLHYKLFAICPDHTETPSLIPISELLAHGQFLCDDGGRHAVNRDEVLTRWFPNELIVAAAQRDYEKPSDKILGRLALKLPKDPYGLACLLKLSSPIDVAKEAEHDFRCSVQWQLLSILVKWKRLKPEATVGRLRRLLTKRNWCTQQMFDEGMSRTCLTPTSPSASQFGVPANILQCQPSGREIALLCNAIGVNYVFLFLDLGLDYVIIDQERTNSLGELQNQIMHLLEKWRQLKGTAATYRQLFNSARVTNIDTEKLAKAIRNYTP